VVVRRTARRRAHQDRAAGGPFEKPRPELLEATGFTRFVELRRIGDEIAAALDEIRQKTPMFARVEHRKIPDRIVDVEKIAALRALHQRLVQSRRASPDVTDVDAPRRLDVKGTEQQRIGRRREEVAGSAGGVLDGLDARLEIRKHAVEVPQHLQPFARLRDHAGPQLSHHTHQTTAFLTQPLDEIHVSQILRVEAKRKEQLVLLLDDDSPVDSRRLTGGYPIEISADSAVAFRWRGRGDDVHAVAAADHVLELIARATGDVITKVPHREQQDPRRVSRRASRMLRHHIHSCTGMIRSHPVS